MSEKQPPEEAFDVSALYRSGAVEQPPESLDQNILEQAKRHAQMMNVDALDQQRTNRLGRSWQWPVSAAAVVVIASSLTIDLYQKDRITVETFPEIQMHSPLPPASMMKPAQSVSDFEVEQDLPSEPGVAMDDLSDPAVMEALKEVQSGPRIEQTPPHADSFQTFTTQESASGVKHSGELKKSSPASSASVQSTQNMEQQALQKEEVWRESLKRERSALSNPQPMAAEAKADVNTLGPERHKSPDEWLTEIEALFEEGRDSEAREALAKFRETHPSVEIPESILGLESKVHKYEK